LSGPRAPNILDKSTPMAQGAVWPHT